MPRTGARRYCFARYSLRAVRERQIPGAHLRPDNPAKCPMVGANFASASSSACERCANFAGRFSRSATAARQAAWGCRVATRPPVNSPVQRCRRFDQLQAQRQLLRQRAPPFANEVHERPVGELDVGAAEVRPSTAGEVAVRAGDRTDRERRVGRLWRMGLQLPVMNPGHDLGSGCGSGSQLHDPGEASFVRRLRAAELHLLRMARTRAAHPVGSRERQGAADSRGS
jgi:hypothetical protein